MGKKGEGGKEEMSLSEAATLSAFLRGVLKGAEECLGFLSYIHTTFIL